MAVVEQAEWKCTAEEYHADTERQSRSMLWAYRENPLEYHGLFISRTIERKPPTPEMITGSLSHLVILEPDRLKTDVVVIPENVLAKNGAKSTNAYHDFAAEHAGKLLVKRDEFELARKIVDAVHADSQVKKFRLLEGGQPERTIVWQDNETGLECKARFDYWQPNGPVPFVVDIKTMDDVRPDKFIKKAADLGYYFQDGFYRDGQEAVSGERPVFVFVCVSKKPPFSVACHSLDATFASIAKSHVRSTLNALAKSIQYDDWLPEHCKQINEIGPPIYLENSYRWENKE